MHEWTQKTPTSCVATLPSSNKRVMFIEAPPYGNPSSCHSFPPGLCSGLFSGLLISRLASLPTWSSQDIRIHVIKHESDLITLCWWKSYIGPHDNQGSSSWPCITWSLPTSPGSSITIPSSPSESLWSLQSTTHSLAELCICCRSLWNTLSCLYCLTNSHSFFRSYLRDYFLWGRNVSSECG